MRKSKSTLYCLPALAVLTSAVMAQDLTSKKGETMLPEEGDYSLGFDADPFLDYVGNFLNQGSVASPNAFGMDRSIVGRCFQDAQTAYTGRFRLGYGTSSNVTGDPFNGESSTVTQFSLGVPFELGEYLKFNAGVSETYYSDAPTGRDGSDDLIHGYYLGGKSERNIGTWGRYNGNFQVNYGGLSSLELGDISEGLAMYDRTLLSSRSTLTFRTDGADIGSNGLEYLTSYRGRLYNSDDGDLYDTHQYEISQAINYIVNPSLTLWTRGAYREKDWDALPGWDSHGYKLGAGVSGRVNDVGYKLGVTYERREYQDALLNTTRVLGYEALVHGCQNGFSWQAYCNHGTTDRNITNAFQLPLADARGTRCGGSVSRDFGNDVKGSVYFQGLYLDSNVGMAADLKSHYYSGGVMVEKDLNNGISVGASAGLQMIEYESGALKQKDSSENFSVFINYEF